MILPRHLRPRLTPRNVLCTLLAMFAVHRLLSGEPLLSSPLPEYTGPYGVGTMDIEVPAARPRRFSDAVHRDTGRPAFELETVLFSLYYPCAKGTTSNKEHHPWIPDGSSALYGKGYARFAGLGGWWGAAKVFETGLWSLVGSTTIPAEVDVPLLLLRAEEPEGATAHGAVPTGEAAGKRSSGSRASQDHDGKGAAADEVGPGQQQHVLQTTGVDGGTLPPGPPGSRFPVVVFSHGFAASRTSYSQYAAELASRGYVVAAVEHRDGSAAASVVRNKAAGTPPRTVLLAPRESIDPVPDVPELKRAQLAQRQAEMEETARVLRAINAGDGDVFGASSRGEGAGLPDWAGRLDTDRIVIAGHSYGATLALQALKPGAGEGEGEDAEGRRPPFAAGIVLDPGKNSGRLNGDVDMPLLVVHSQSWSAKHSVFFGRPHFDAVKQIVADLLDRRRGRRGHRDAWFLTARDTAHTAVMDAPLIEPTLLAWSTGATMDAYEGLMQYVNVSVDFLRYVHGGGGDIKHGELGVLGEPVSHPQCNEESRPLPPELAKYWQVHVSPVS